MFTRAGFVSALLLVLFLVSAVGSSAANSAAAAATKSASFYFLSPNTSTISGKVRWQAGSYSSAVYRVDFSLDSGPVSWSEWGSPYLYNGDTGTLNTATLKNGSHTLRAVESDSSGRILATASKSVIVFNAGSVPPPVVTTPVVTTPVVTTPVVTTPVVTTPVVTTPVVTTPVVTTPVVTPPVVTPPVVATPAMPVFSAPAFTAVRTVVITSRAQFDSAWAGLQPGDYLDVRGVAFSGETVFAKQLSGWAEVHFDSGVRFLGAAAGSRLPSVWVHDSQNVRFFGGDVTGAGNDGIRFDDDVNVTWWGFNVHDTAGTGILARGIAHNTSGLDLVGSITACGSDLSLDPHAEKGTGNHGINIGTGTGMLVTGSRFELTVRDQAYGAAVEMQGVQNSTLYLDARRITFHAVNQTGGNALQIWGSDTRGLDVAYLYADSLAGEAVYTGGLDASNANIAVDYARATNVRLSPTYVNDPKITYDDIG